MKCLNPQRIKNKYTGQWMFVPCRKCDACRIASANSKAFFLQNEMQKYVYSYFLTLTYSNEHIPFILEGSNIINRLSSPVYGKKHHLSYQVMDFPCCLDILDEFFFPTGEEKKIRNFPSDDAISILYYKDLQNFLKRFRYYVNQKVRFFACGEYGDTGRCHFHVIVECPNRLDYSKVVYSTIKAWPFCDWSKLDLQQCVKYADSGVSFYLASYVNCATGISDFLSKQGRQKTLRSANLDFGVCSSDYQAIRDFIKGRSNKFGNGDTQPPLCVPRVSEGFAVSFVPISPRVFRAYFRKPSGCIKICTDDFSRRSRKVYCFFAKGGKYIPALRDKNLVKSTDYLYWLSYRRYCDLLGLNLLNYQTHEDYIINNLHAQTTYASLLLKSQMMSYKPEFVKDYYTELCNTFAENPYSDRAVWFRRLLGVSDAVMSQREQNAVSNYVFKYKHKLVSKHYNDL